jgi:hypothetical protein
VSYCRWSSDDFQCDLYVYGASDGITIYVAGQRHAIPADKLPPPVDDNDEDAWVKRHMAVMELVRVAPLEPIGLPFDGEAYYGLTELDAAAKIRELIAVGYRCDPSVADELESEGRPLRSGIPEGK